MLSAVAAIGQAIHYDSQIDEAARAVGAAAADVADERSVNLSGVLFRVIPTVILAAWLGVTAGFMRRRSNVARILALVGLAAPLALVALGCLVGGLVGFMFIAVAGESGTQSGPDSESDPFGYDGGSDVTWPGDAFYNELGRISDDGLSVAFSVIGGVAGLLALVLGIATAVLLLVRSTARYFKPLPMYPQYGAYPYPYPYPPAPYGYAPPPMPYGYAPPPADPTSFAPGAPGFQGGPGDPGVVGPVPPADPDAPDHLTPRDDR